MPSADQRTRILIVPADLLAAAVGASFLDRSSLEVRKVADSAAALATVALWQPHLIVFRADPSGEQCHSQQC